MTTIEAHEITKVYGSTPAVDRVTFTVRPGVVTGFLGPNGAGKSTTMRLIFGLDRPTSGTATIGGRHFAAADRPLTLAGALLDAFAAHPARTARNHLLVLAASNGLSARRVGTVLDEVGLAPVAGRRVSTFSLGMRQRLGIAAALLGDPPVLILDEPSNGLDPEGIIWLRETLRRLARAGRTVLVSSHLMSETASFADHLLVLGRGRVLADTGIDEFVRAYATPRVRLRTSAGARIQEVLARAGHTTVESDGDRWMVHDARLEEVGPLLVDAGIPVLELADEPGSLEQAYLALTSDAPTYTAHTTKQEVPP
ncbi:ABC transporter ATP-binding protein [Nocardia brevicatena]|uniref:ABC transporter ATP-binding protein n=1 Tax=Nocardia brevicatena TaxID=37327 RepID=UPI0002E848CB|nr:ATP-binding cassette domain-containing protein [Nocardia brevicatena]